MFGIVLIGISQLFAEFSTSLGKYEYSKHRESLLAFGFLHAFWATVFLFALAYFRDSFIFSWESLPTFALRAVFEIILVFTALRAIVESDRSTYAFLHTLTIPFLLGVDVILGYDLSLPQVIGIALMASAIMLLTINHGLSRRGKMLSLIAALIPVITVSLYKYNITHYNSVEAEQALQHVVLLIALLIAAWYRTGENLFAQIVNRKHLAQSLSAGAASVFLSYAFLFAPASVIITAKRTFEVLAAILFGKTYFKEKHLLLKLAALVLMAGGVALLVL